MTAYENAALNVARLRVDLSWNVVQWKSLSGYLDIG